MRLPAVFAAGDAETTLRGLDLPLDLDRLVPGSGPWEVELGFGKGRYLLQRARQSQTQQGPERRFLGVELVSRYYRMARRRARRRGPGGCLDNLLLVRGEALYLLATVLPRAFADVVHVYFPDPWPKSRHAKRRLFDPETVDLVLGVLRPGGELCFATDFLDYGRRVTEILRGLPGLAVEVRDGPWPEGPRTNYEAKYVLEGRPILRLSARWTETPEGSRLHPRGAAGILAATAARDDGQASLDSPFEAMLPSLTLSREAVEKMPDLKLGDKHECLSCGAKFYDFGKAEKICPRCGTDQLENSDAAPDEPKKKAAVKKAVVKPDEDGDDLDEDLDEDDDLDEEDEVEGDADLDEEDEDDLDEEDEAGDLDVEDVTLVDDDPDLAEDLDDEDEDLDDEDEEPDDEDEEPDEEI
jgi:tRNA (guanine-N7-)-methyltransferase